MTALAAYWHFYEAPDAQANCERMLGSQRIYAPQDRPVVTGSGSFALGRCLNRFLPEDRFDRGPMSGGGGRFLLVADVRLDNRDALLSALGLAVSDAVTLSDAALLMRLWERWEEACVSRLSGDFAFVLWDYRKERLFLARDFLGHRPLHYHVCHHLVAVASMPKGLHVLPEVPYEPNRSRAAAFLARVPDLGPETYFDQICRVEPGNLVTVDRQGLRSESYWRPDLTPLRLRDGREYADGLRERLSVASKRALRGAGATVGCQLSGGLDSSSVLASAAPLAAEAGSRVVAFTAVPGDLAAEERSGRFIDEGHHAALTVKRFANVDHTLVRSDGRSPLEGIDRNFYLYDSPIPNLANLGWWDSINDAAKGAGIKVLLTGQLGNLTISYMGIETLPALLAEGKWLSLARLMIQLVSNGVPVGDVASWTCGPFVPPGLWKTVTSLAGRPRFDPVRDGALRGDRSAKTGPRPDASRADASCRPRRGGAELRVRAMQRVDIGNYNKGIIAGWGVDVRDPTADRDLVEYCLRVPLGEFIADGVPSSLVRRAFAHVLPEEVLMEKRRGYQGADWYLGVQKGQAALREEVARIGASAAGSDIINVEKLRSLIEELPKSGWQRRATEIRYRTALLRAVSIGHFLRKASGSNG